MKRLWHRIELMRCLLHKRNQKEESETWTTRILLKLLFVFASPDIFLMELKRDIHSLSKLKSMQTSNIGWQKLINYIKWDPRKFIIQLHASEFIYSTTKPFNNVIEFKCTFSKINKQKQDRMEADGRNGRLASQIAIALLHSILLVWRPSPGLDNKREAISWIMNDPKAKEDDKLDVGYVFGKEVDPSFLVVT